jgi:hypothetical protein
MHFIVSLLSKNKNGDYHMKIYDGLNGNYTRNNRITQLFREYNPINFEMVHVPPQHGSDCGFFILEIVRAITNNENPQTINPEHIRVKYIFMFVQEYLKSCQEKDPRTIQILKKNFNQFMSKNDKIIDQLGFDREKFDVLTQVDSL